jgi:hypothetical protein
MKKINKVICSALLVCMVVAFIPIKTHAALASGTKKYVTVGGYYYSYWSSVVSQTSYVQGLGVVGSPNKVNFPTGYYGVNARLYNSSGTLVKSSGWHYNDNSAGGTTYGSGQYYRNGTFYAKSQMKFYNGNGYNTYTSNSSPMISRNQMNMKERINAQGTTYGSDFYAQSEDEAPDLVRVLGKNGVEGYVYAYDLYNEPTNLSEVKDYIKTQNKTYSIPVYDENGMTVIDEFEITNNVIEDVVY